MDPDIACGWLFPKEGFTASETLNVVSIVISAEGKRKIAYQVIDKRVEWEPSVGQLVGCKDRDEPLYCIIGVPTRDLAGDCSGRCEEFINTAGQKGQGISVMETREQVAIRLEGGPSCTADLLPDQPGVLCRQKPKRACVQGRQRVRCQRGKVDRVFRMLDVG